MEYETNRASDPVAEHVNYESRQQPGGRFTITTDGKYGEWIESDTVMEVRQ